MSHYARTLAVCAAAFCFWAGDAEAAETADVSLAKEVDRYLDTTQAEGADPSTFRAYWDKGLKFGTSDGNFKVSVFGRLMVDALFWSSDDVPSSDTEDSFFFRRVRLGVGGTVYKNVIFKVQIDFAGEEEFVDRVTATDTDASGDIDSVSTRTDDVGDVTLKDVYVGLKKVFGKLTLKIGHHFQPLGLEALTSSKYITFMERSAPTNAFAPGRDTGFSLAGDWWDKRITAAIGMFKKSSNRGISMEDGGYHLTFRITGLVIDNPDDKTFLHVGFGFTFRDTEDDGDRFRARPGTGKGSRYADTGSLAADDVYVVNFELLVIWQSFHAQLEFFLADVSAPTGVAVEPQFTGWYVEVAYWITGESTKYKGGKRARVSPKANFHDGGGGWGAWQVAFRFDNLDLTDDTVIGGEQQTFTIGVNWHWNPNTRVMFNVVLASIETTGSPDVDIEIFQMRFQFDF